MLGLTPRRVFQQPIHFVFSPIPLSVVAALIIGGGILIGSGVNPVTAYGAVISGSLGDGNLPFTIATAVPIVGMAFSFAIPLRAGQYNLGGDGQLVLGGVSAAAVALYAPLPGPLGVVVPLAAAALASGAYAAITAVLQARFGVPLLISTLLLSYPAVSLGSYLATFPMKVKGAGIAETPVLPANAHLPSLAGYYVNLGVVLVGVLVLGLIVMDLRTTFGFEAKMAGFNPSFAEYAGVDVGRLVVKLLFISGGIAGLVGGILVLSPPFRFIDGALTAPQYSFAGLLAALLAGGAPIGVLIAGIAFTILDVGALGMQDTTGIPAELSLVLQGVVIVCLTLRAGIFQRGKAAPA
jgi:general nucleoside transport system permease protein